MDKLTAYKKEIIKEAFFCEELSGNDITQITNKSLPSVVKIIGELMDEGWITKTGNAVSTGGRRANMFSIASGAFYIVAVAIDQHITQVALIDVHKKIVGNIETLELNLKDNSTAFEKIVGFINSFIDSSGIDKTNMLGVGVSMPGFVEAAKGINHSYFKNVHGSLSNAISKEVALPVFIDNDSSLMALAELKIGAARNLKNAMVINLGWGIGLGMIINGKLFRGDKGFAGEFSHIPFFMNDKICDCGKSGCLETETSLYVMSQKAVEGVEAGKTTLLKNLSLEHLQKTTEEILKTASKGDRFAVELLSEIAFNIGIGVATLIHIMNPGQIILTGRGAIAGKLWLAPLQQAINVHCIPRLAGNTTIEISELGERAGLMGATALVIENLSKEIFVKRSIKTGLCVV